MKGQGGGMRDSQIGFTIKQMKKYEWFVHEIEIQKLKEQLDKLSAVGWEIYQIDRYDSSMKTFFSIIARRQICKTT